MAGGGGVKKKEEKENAEMEERKRLMRLALKNNLLSETAASGSHAPTLSPSKIVMKHHGKDILRKSQRSGKNRYLFSFPGLLAPVSSGKIGELKDLGTKNPILYLDFPQGQMKLFGTIVYPKNRYLTLQFSRGGKNVACEDYFDNMIMFSDAWWIGQKDENPEEARLEFPKELNMEHIEYDFNGGAGATTDKKQVISKPERKYAEQQSPKHELEKDSSDSQTKSEEIVEVTPTRRSARNAGKTLKFTEASSGDDFVENDTETSEGEEEKIGIIHAQESYSSKKMKTSCQMVRDVDEVDAETGTSLPGKTKQTAKSASKTKQLAHGNQGSLVQTTISTLFKKAGAKGAQTDVEELKDGVKVPGPRRKRKAIQDRKAASAVQKKQTKIEEDDIEEFTSTSQDADSNDDDWLA